MPNGTRTTAQHWSHSGWRLLAGWRCLLETQVPATARNLLRAQPPDDRASDPTIEHLYVAEGPRLLRYFQRKTGNCHTAPDLVQDAFARLAASDRLPELLNPAAYLQVIARNLLIDRARGSQSRNAYVPLEEWDAATPPPQEETLVARDTMRRYEEAIAAMPERTRTVFLLKRTEELTYVQIAKRLGVTLWTVEHHMKRALSHLGRALDAR